MLWMINALLRLQILLPSCLTYLLTSSESSGKVIRARSDLFRKEMQSRSFETVEEAITGARESLAQFIIF